MKFAKFGWKEASKLLKQLLEKMSKYVMFTYFSI